MRLTMIQNDGNVVACNRVPCGLTALPPAPLVRPVTALMPRSATSPLTSFSPLPPPCPLHPASPHLVQAPQARQAGRPRVQDQGCGARAREHLPEGIRARRANVVKGGRW